jgi:hypothetical protein
VADTAARAQGDGGLALLGREHYGFHTGIIEFR